MKLLIRGLKEAPIACKDIETVMKNKSKWWVNKKFQNNRNQYKLFEAHAAGIHFYRHDL
jgi:hypothetical protein